METTTKEKISLYNTFIWIDRLEKRMDRSDSDYIFKVLLLGEAAVGKTSITNRFAKSEFSLNYSVTLCLDVIRRVIQVGDKKVSLQIWDTVGQERFRTITSSYYKGSVSLNEGRKGFCSVLASLIDSLSKR